MLGISTPRTSKRINGLDARLADWRRAWCDCSSPATCVPSGGPPLAAIFTAESMPQIRSIAFLPLAVCLAMHKDISLCVRDAYAALTSSIRSQRSFSDEHEISLCCIARQTAKWQNGDRSKSGACSPQ